jgi:4-amino-4-deoxy-L-arabinose transferase-like glycosyltransferase
VRVPTGWRFVAVVVLVAAITHLPGFLRTEVLNPDESFIATEAQVVNDGGHLYTDVVDRKPPLVPYLYAATFRVTRSDDLVWVRLLALAAHVATALLVAAIARRRWNERAAFGAAILYLVASGGLVLEDAQPANFEVFMLPFMCAAELLGERGRDAGAGALAALATLAKQVGAATLLPLAYLAWRHRRWWGLARLAAAFGAVIVVTGLAFGWSDFYYWVFTDTGGYLDASGSFTVALGRGAAGFGVFFGANLGALLLLWHAVRRWRENADLWLWFLSAVISVAAGLRFFGHYFLQLAPPFALLAAAGLARASRFAWWRTAALATASVALFLVMAMAWHPNLLHRYDRIAAAIDEQTTSSDHIFVWGHFPQLYWASDRRPATRFLTSGFLTGFSGGRSAQHVGPEFAVEGAWDDFASDFADHPPALIADASVGTSFPIDRFPDVAKYLQDYRPIGIVDGVVLYVRK